MEFASFRVGCFTLTSSFVNPNMIVFIFICLSSELMSFYEEKNMFLTSLFVLTLINPLIPGIFSQSFFHSKGGTVKPLVNVTPDNV